MSAIPNQPYAVITPNAIQVGNAMYLLGRGQNDGELYFQHNNQRCWKNYTELPRAIQEKMEALGFKMVCNQTRNAHAAVLAELATLRRTTTIELEALTVFIQ